MRIEYQQTASIGDSQRGHANHHFSSLGINWRFGHTQPRTIIKKEKYETVIETTKKFVLNKENSGVLFATNSSVLQESGSIKPIVKLLLEKPNSTVLIEGHTDNQGEDKYNQFLSERRAKSLMTYLIRQGVAAKRISIVGYGESKPVASNSTEIGRQLNRRVEVIITSVVETEVKTKTINPKN